MTRRYRAPISDAVKTRLVIEITDALNTDAPIAPILERAGVSPMFVWSLLDWRDKQLTGKGTRNDRQK